MMVAEHVVAHWLVMLLFLFAWLGFLAWRWLRVKRHMTGVGETGVG